jgi:dTDP-glucose 4,6-dehydratase
VTAPQPGRRVVVTGGAGFLGSHLCDALVARGDRVVCVDDLSTGRLANIAHLLDRPDGALELVVADVAGELPVQGPVAAVAHLASPASPPDYLARPLKTLAVGSEGTRRALELAAHHRARFLLASTSEVYGDPTVHPQPETYWGHVNPIGPRSVYDEAKRFAEALTMAHHRQLGADVVVVRIFNTYGPRLRPGDGRVVANFVAQALTGQPLTVYGDGSQTRSLCFVDDTVGGLLAALDGPGPGPYNLGNPEELTVADLAALVLHLTGSKSAIEHRPLPEDDPTRRCPDIQRARRRLGWAPTTPLEVGLRRTIDWMADQLGAAGSPGPTASPTAADGSDVRPPARHGAAGASRGASR